MNKIVTKPNIRPSLDETINPEVFLDFYWLKEELFVFCKEQRIPTGGSKKVITQRIYHYLRTGEILSEEKNGDVEKYDKHYEITLDAIIPRGYKNDEQHRKFFKTVIGSHFKYNVLFMSWMKANRGKTYSEAVDEWIRIDKEKKSGKKLHIAPQFEYNQYTRDFFLANPELKHGDAITCWKYKKSLRGHNKYENGDLVGLDVE